MPVDYSVETRVAYLRWAASLQTDAEADIQKYRDFFDGDQNIYLTDRQKQYIKSSPDSFANLCKRICNIVGDRLETGVDYITPEDDTSQAYADLVSDWWRLGGLQSEQKVIYEAALRDGETAIIVDWDYELGIPRFKLNILYDGADGHTRLHYDDNNELMFASKRWTISTHLDSKQIGKTRLNIYRPDLIERYVANSDTPGGWKLIDPDELGMDNPQFWTTTGTASGDPLGLPVIPFTCQQSELSDVLSLQEMINHNLASMDQAVDLLGKPFIVFKGAELPIGSSGSPSVTIEAGTGYNVDSGGGVDIVEGADLSLLFDGGVMNYIKLIAMIKGWPMFALSNSGDIPSGIALQKAEESLVGQVIDKQNRFESAWLKAFDMGKKLHNINTGKNIEGVIDLGWRSPNTSDPMTDIELKAKEFDTAQYPLITRWRMLGKSEDEIQMILDEHTQGEEAMLTDFNQGITQ